MWCAVFLGVKVDFVCQCVDLGVVCVCACCPSLSLLVLVCTRLWHGDDELCPPSPPDIPARRSTSPSSSPPPPPPLGRPPPCLSPSHVCVLATAAALWCWSCPSCCATPCGPHSPLWCCRGDGNPPCPHHSACSPPLCVCTVSVRAGVVLRLPVCVLVVGGWGGRGWAILWCCALVYVCVCVCARASFVVPSRAHVCADRRGQWVAGSGQCCTPTPTSPFGWAPPLPLTMSL